MKELKKLPMFKDEAEESIFWDQHDVTDYFDMSNVKPVRFSNLKKNDKKYIAAFTR